MKGRKQLGLVEVEVEVKVFAVVPFVPKDKLCLEEGFPVTATSTKVK